MMQTIEWKMTTKKINKKNQGNPGSIFVLRMAGDADGERLLCYIGA